jgi:hypothetical protein
MCEGGGYVTREQLAKELDAERTHDRERLVKRAGCEFC